MKILSAHYELLHPREKDLIETVFNTNPLAGDLIVDGQVNTEDLIELSYYGLYQNRSMHNDYYERANANKDKVVDLADFALSASNWPESL